MGFSLKNFLEESRAQVNPFDKGKTAQTVRQQRATTPPPQKQSPINQVAGAISRAKPMAQNFVNNRPRNVNDLARKMPKPVVDWSKRTMSTNNVVNNPYTRNAVASTLGTARSAVSRAEEAGGLYDLVTPGRGTNRFTQNARQIGAKADKMTSSVKLRGNNYTAGQVATDLASFLIPGAIASKVAKVPTVASKTASVASKFPRVAKVAPMVTNVLADTIQGAGQRTARNQDNSLATAGMDAGLSLATAGALTGGSKLLSAGAEKLAPVAKKIAGKATSKVASSPSVSDLTNVMRYKQDRGSFVDDAVHSQRLESLRKFGIDPTKPESWTQIDRVLASQGGYIKNPLANDAPQGKTPKTEVATPITQPQVQRIAQTEALPPATRPDGTMVAQGGGLSNTPDGTVANQPISKKTKYASKTVPESEFVSDQVSKSVKENAPTYEVQTERARYTDSLGRVKERGLDDFTNDLTERLQVKDGMIDAQTVADGQTAAAMLDAQGDPVSLQKATRIYEDLSRHLTASGQTIQAASILSRRTPDGLQYGAIKTLKQAGVEITPQLQVDLKLLIDDVRKTKAGTEAGDMARYKVAEFVNKSVPSSFADKTVNLWKAGLLTSPRTTAGNIAANTAETIFSKGYVDPLANVVDSFMSLFTGKRSRSLTGRGLVSGAGEGAVKGVKYFKTGYDPRNPAKKFDIKEIHYSDTPLGKTAEAYTQAVFRLMGSQDQPFYYANLRNSLYDQAITEAKNLKLKGDAKSSYIKKFITEPSKVAMELADKEAKYAVFQNDTTLGKIASGFKDKAGAVGDFAIPFSGVPSSVATRMVERTPIGTATEIIKQIRSKNFDQRAMTKAIANGSAAIPIAGAGYALANAGLMTLGYPTDQKERDLWEAEGKQPYSIKVGDTWLSTNYFQPAGNILAAGAEYASKLKDGGTQTEALSSAGAGSAKALTEQSFLKGLSGIISAFSDPQKAGEKFIENTAGSVVPNLIGTVARATDPVARRADGLLDQVKSDIPGLRQTLDTKTNMFGQDIKRRSGTANELLNPFKPSDAQNTNDQTLQELRRLQDSDLGVTTPDIKSNSITGEKLNPSQIEELRRIVNPEIKSAWDKVISDPSYASMSDDEKQKTLSEISSDIYGARKAQYQAKNSLGYYNPNNTEAKKPDLSNAQKRLVNGEEIDFIAGDLPKGYEKLDKSIQSFYGEYTSRDEETSKEWLAKPLDDKHSVVFEKLNQIKPEGFPDLPKTNQVAKLYADFKKKQSEGNWSKLQDNEERKDFLKSAYKTQLTPEQKFIDDLGTNKLIGALKSGDVTPDQVRSMVELDNTLIQLGATPMLSKTIRRELGLGLAPSTGGSSGSSGSSRSSKGRKSSGGGVTKGVSNEIFNLMNTSSVRSSNSNALRKILNSAKL